MCLGYTAKSRDCQYCVIVIALCPSYCDIVLFLFVLLLFAGLLVAKTGLRCRPRALLDPSPKQGITKALWSIQRKGILCFAIFGILKTNSKILWLLKGILCQKNYIPCLNPIFWIIMRGGIAHFGRSGLKTNETKINLV